MRRNMEEQKAEIDKSEPPEDVGAAEEGAGSDEAQPTSMHPLIRRDLILIACLVISGLAGGAAFGVLHPRLSPAASVEAPTDAPTTPAPREEAISGEEQEQNTVCPFEPFLLVYEDDLFKVRLTMELESEEALSELTERKAEIRAGIYQILKNSELIEVVNGERPLQIRLLEAVNQSLRRGRAIKISFGALHDQE